MAWDDEVDGDLDDDVDGDVDDAMPASMLSLPLTPSCRAPGILLRVSYDASSYPSWKSSSAFLESSSRNDSNRDGGS